MFIHKYLGHQKEVMQLQPINSWATWESMATAARNIIVLINFHLLILARRIIKIELRSCKTRKIHHGNLFFMHSVPRICGAKNGDGELSVVGSGWNIFVNAPKIPGIGVGVGAFDDAPEAEVLDAGDGVDVSAGAFPQANVKLKSNLAVAS
jgi:hypothetical protein